MPPLPNTLFPDLETVYDGLYRYCYHRLHHRQQAEDVTQEAFLRTFAAAPEFTGPNRHGQALRYLYTVARNLCIDLWRRAPREAAALPQEENAQPAQPDFGPALTESLALRAALDSLPDAQRELLLLRYSGELPVGTIAGMLGISRFAVYRQINHALAALRQLLQQGEE